MKEGSPVFGVKLWLSYCPVCVASRGLVSVGEGALRGCVDS